MNIHVDSPQKCFFVSGTAPTVAEYVNGLINNRWKILSLNINPHPTGGPLTAIILAEAAR